MCRVDAARNGVTADVNVVSSHNADRNVLKYTAGLRATRFAALSPPQQRQKLGEDHRRRPPNLMAADVEGGDQECAAVPFALARNQTRAIEQVVHRDLEDARDFAVSRSQLGTPTHDRDHWMETEAADWNIDWRERAENPRVGAREGDFLVGLTQRRLLERLARVHGAARQRDLSAVPAQRVRSNGQHDMRAMVDRKDQQQARRMANPGGIESLRPPTRGLRGKDSLCGGAGKGAAQTIRKTLDDFIKMHE